MRFDLSSGAVTKSDPLWLFRIVSAQPILESVEAGKTVSRGPLRTAESGELHAGSQPSATSRRLRTAADCWPLGAECLGRHWGWEDLVALPGIEPGFSD